MTYTEDLWLQYHKGSEARQRSALSDGFYILHLMCSILSLENIKGYIKNVYSKPKTTSKIIITANKPKRGYETS